MKDSKQLFEWLKANAPPSAHIQRVETMASIGMPDVNVCYHGRETWVEIKNARMVNRDTLAVAVKIEPSQVAWAARRVTSGGRIKILMSFLNDDRIAMIPDGPKWLKNLIPSIVMSVRIDQRHLFTLDEAKDQLKEFLFL